MFVLYAISDDPFYGNDPGFGKMQAGILMAGLLLAASSRLSLDWVHRILLLSGGSLIALACAEMACSLFLAPRYRPVFLRDDRLLFKLAPGRYSEFTRVEGNGGGRYLTRINTDGYVGKELLPTGAQTRVLIYGDSFIHTYYVKPEDGFAQQLEDALRAPWRGHRSRQRRGRLLRAGSDRSAHGRGDREAAARSGNRVGVRRERFRRSRPRPYPGDVAEHYYSFKVDLARFPDYRPENITNTLKDIAERNGLTYLNLWDTFRPLDAEKLFLHGGDDHWNEAGQHIAAEALADFIAGRRLLGPPGTSR